MGTRFNYLAKAVLKSTISLCFEQKSEEYQNFLSENFYFWVVSVYLNRHVFVMLPVAVGQGGKYFHKYSG